MPIRGIRGATTVTADEPDLILQATRELLEEILTSEEGHAEWLEAQFDLIKQVGEHNYLAQQIYKS